MSEDYTSRQVADLHGRGEIQLIDVREDYEYDAGRISGAVHIPLSELPSALDTLESARPVVFYCRSGARSAMATQAFEAAGFDAHNMTGGLLDWEATGLPLEPEGAYVEG